MIPVKKPDGRICVCVDFRRLNAVTHPLSCYMPMLEELLNCIGLSTVISKLDQSKGFHQVPVNIKDMVKMAFVCPWGKYEYRGMLFGLQNAPAVF